jgi:predicted transcriptional regulator
LLSTKVAIDIVFIALVIVAILITAIVVARIMTDNFSVRSDSAQTKGPQQESSDNEVRLTITDPDAEEMMTQRDRNLDPQYSSSSGERAANPADRVAASIYGSSPVILPLTWGAVAGTLIWRGKVRSAWSRQGYDYDTFKLLTKMRGSPMRIRLLNAINDSPKNKLQLAKELDVDWKTIDNHIEMLLQSRLVEERTVVGTARYYAITHDGAKVLSLLSSSSSSSEMADSEKTS